MGDDVQMKQMKWYFAFRRLRNFTCVQVQRTKQRLLAYAHVDPKSVTHEKNFTRDVSKVGHYGTGALEIIVRNADDFEKAKPLLLKVYEGR